MQLNDEEVKGAWMRLFRQPEGRVAYASLAAILAEIGPIETCALHAHWGRRSLAANLMALAIAEPEASDGSGSEPRERSNAANGGKKSRRHGPAGR